MSHYRSDEEGLQQQIIQQRERIEQELKQARRLQGLYQRRVARSVAGQVAAFCGVMLFVCAFFVLDGESLAVLSREDHDFRDLEEHSHSVVYRGLGASTHFLLLAPLSALLAYVVALLSAWVSFRLQQRGPRLTRDLRWDASLLSSWQPLTQARQLVASLTFHSLVWPLTALSLLMPLSLHFIVALLADGWSASASFHEWIKTSAALVGQCHLALVLLCWMYVHQLNRVPSKRLSGLGVLSWTSASAMLPVGALTIPGSFFLAGFILSVFVFFTGLWFVPLMIKWAEIQHKKESATLGAIGS